MHGAFLEVAYYTGINRGSTWATMGFTKNKWVHNTHAQNISRSRQSIETCVGTLGIGLTVQELAPL